jgi:hypothetical protein
MLDFDMRYPPKYGSALDWSLYKEDTSLVFHYTRCGGQGRGILRQMYGSTNVLVIQEGGWLVLQGAGHKSRIDAPYGSFGAIISMGKYPCLL